MPPHPPAAAQRVSDLLLERFSLGELPPDRLAAVQAMIDADPGLQARLRDLRNEDRAIRLQHPPRTMATAIRARAGVAAPKQRSRWMLAAPGLAMAAAAMLFVMLSGPRTFNDVAKGDAGDVAADLVPELRVFREDDGELVTGDRVGPGDVLGFKYDAAGYDFGALLSIDGAGVVTLHMPESEGDSLALEHGLVTLSVGYELDDAPDFERFFLVLSETDFELAAVLDAARDLASANASEDALEVSETLEVVDFRVDKVPSMRGGTP